MDEHPPRAPQAGRWHERLAVRVGAYVFLGALLPAWVLLGSTILDDRKRLPNQAVHHVRDMAALVAVEVEHDVRDGHLSALRESLAELLQNELRERRYVAMRAFAVVDARGQVLAHSELDAHPLLSPLKLPADGLTWSDTQLIDTVTLVDPMTGLPNGRVSLVFDGAPVFDELRDSERRAVIWGLLAVALAAGLALLTSRRVSVPLQLLEHQSAFVGTGRVDIASLRDAAIEVRDLARAIHDADRQIAAATRELSDQERLFRAVLDNSPAVIYIRDMKGRYVRVNRRFEEMFGRVQAEVVGRTDAEVFAADAAVRPPESFVSDGARAAIRQVNFARGGGHLHHLVAEFPLVDPDGAITAMGTIATDITAQTRSEDQASRLAAIVEQAHEAVVVTDLSGVIEYVNRPFECMSGYSRAELVGRSPRLLKSGRHDPEYYREMWRALREDGRWSGDFTNRNKSGALYEVEQSIVALTDKRGAVVGYAGLQRDVTEARSMTRRLRHADRVKSLGVLAGGIAHDFNNLLTAILGNAALARQLGASDQVAECLGDIECASQSAADLCQQMLAYSGKGRFVVRLVNVSEVVRGIANLLRVSVAKNVRVTYQFDQDLPAIRADVAQVQQVVLNLITNASEAIGAGDGAITLSTFAADYERDTLDTLLTEHTLQPGRYVALQVADTGCGMDAETVRHVFDPFFTTKFHGRGLGMSAMLGIVQGHGGGVRIDTAVGRGTTVLVLFPVAEEPLAQRIADAAAAPSTQDDGWAPSGTVLLIDDEEPVRKVVATMLGAIGYDVVVADGGEEGLRLFAQHREHIALVVLDMTMPDMDGVACFRRLREQDPEVRVLLSSGYARDEVIARFAGDAPEGFLRKPFVPDALSEAIRATLFARPD